MTTVQDLATIYPFDDEHLDAILQAYEDIGIRCVFALQFADMAGAKAVPFWGEVVPPGQRGAPPRSVHPLQGVDLPRLAPPTAPPAKHRHPPLTPPPRPPNP